MYQARSSKSTPPYLTQVLANVPEVLREQISDYLPKGDLVRGVFVIPPEVYSKGFRWELNPLQALVFTQFGILQIFAPDHRHKKREAIWIEGKSVLLIKLKLVLLYGRLEILAESDGNRNKILSEYSTVAHKALSPYLKALIQTTWTASVRNPANVSVPAFEDFVNISLSFYNGINLEALQPGEMITAFAYQPELGKRILKLFRRKIFPKTLAVLTDRQLILLQEDLKTKAHYEWLFTFIPRHRVMSIDRTSIKTNETIVLRLDSAGHDLDVPLIISAQAKSAWRIMLGFLPGGSC